MKITFVLPDLNYVSEYMPDYDGVFAHGVGYLSSSLKLAHFTKAAGRFPTIAGGIHPTVDPENTLNDKNIDMVCLGEGEEALVELCDKMDSGRDHRKVDSIWVKDNGSIVRNNIRLLSDNLESRPFPDRSIFDFKKLSDTRLGMLTVLAGRGCPYDCTYCCNHQYRKLYPNAGKYVRFRDPEAIIQEN